MTPRHETTAEEGAEAPFRIGELARRVGATPRTVRYYEELGLLPDRGRPEGAHRLYERLGFRVRGVIMERRLQP